MASRDERSTLTPVKERPQRLAPPAVVAEPEPLLRGSARSGVARGVRPLVSFARKKPLGALGAMVLLLMVLAALGAEFVSPYPVGKIGLGPSYAAPSLAHPMGLDQLGRDMVSRIIWGGRISLFVGVVSTIVATVLGTTVGIVSAYFGRKVDLGIQRVVDAMISFPSLILALVLMAALGQSTMNIVIAMSFVFVPRMSRVVRASVLTIKEQPYVEAAQTIGASNLRVMVFHILPNIFGPVMVLATLTLGTAIVVEASLSFLGIGTSPDQPSWGRMLSGAATQYFRESPHLAIFPGLAISLAVLAVNFLGDALRDIWDPRLRGSN
jgi:peptide/nickel transport system permease protein